MAAASTSLLPHPSPFLRVSKTCPSLRFHLLLLSLDEAKPLWVCGVGWQPPAPGGSQFQGCQDVSWWDSQGSGTPCSH